MIPDKQAEIHPHPNDSDTSTAHLATLPAPQWARRLKRRLQEFQFQQVQEEAEEEGQ